MTEAVGTLAEEAAKLFGAAEEWWRKHAPAAAEPGEDSGHGGHSGHSAPECRVCPFCQVLSVVRGAQPDLFERVSEAAVALVVALKGAVEGSVETPDSAPHRADVPVERIDIA